MAKLPNPYMRDAPYFLKRAIRGIVPEKNGPENFSHALDLALGFERMLKAILWNEHPAFTLLDESFENTVKVFFSDQVKNSGNDNSEDKRKGPNADSVTFRTAVARAKFFSKAARENQSVLMKLGSIHRGAAATSAKAI